MECPRWRLRTAHYLTVPVLPDGTRVEWEHKEQSRESGRTVRKLFSVPMLLDPRDPADCNYLGDIIVAQEVEGADHPHRQDIIFLGDPTPDMEPLNDAAEAISASHRHRWEHPIDTLPAQGGMSEPERAFMESMMKAFGQQVSANAGGAVVPKAEFDALKAELESIKAMLTQSKAEPSGARRV